LIFGESELGEVAVLTESNNTYAITNTASGARACGWTERGDGQSALSCDLSIGVKDHHVNTH
jgi:hypothetical protein